MNVLSGAKNDVLDRIGRAIGLDRETVASDYHREITLPSGERRTVLVQGARSSPIQFNTYAFWWASAVLPRIITDLVTLFSLARNPALQLELKAKRLIASPPDWAYPRAWTCAVLADLESGDQLTGWRFANGEPSYIEDVLRDYHAARRNGLTADAALSYVLKDSDFCRHVFERVCVAYERGSQKQAGLMQRPRVK
jgi:hypothetical protein